MKRKLKIWSLIVLATVVSATGYGQDVVINEVAYSNKSILSDYNGDYPDWIELYNPTDATINLSGYQITDDSTKSDFWTFPDYEIGSQEYLILFASNKDVIDSNEIHLDFKLSLMNENVYLIDPNGEIIDVVYAECAPADKSLSSVPDGSGNRVVTAPTPGSSNDNAEVFTLNFSPDTLTVNYNSGFYSDPIDLELYNNNPDNSIRYTLDGDLPDENSDIYEGTPLELEDLTSNENRFANIPETYEEPGNKIYKGNIVRATVYSEGCPASNTLTNTYFVNATLKEEYEVPVVSLITEADNLFDDEIGIYVRGNHQNFNQHGKKWERDVHVEIFDKDNTQIIDQDGGLRISGGGSRGAPQKPLRLYARSEYGKEFFSYPFFEQKPDITKYRTLLLRATRGLSGILFKDEMTQALVQDMDIDYSGYQTVIVFLNGEYWGIYSLRERLDEGYIEQNFNVEDPEPDIISHNLYKAVLEEGSIDSYNELKDFFSNCDPTSDAFYDEVSEMIDIPELIDYYVAENYFANSDFPHNNLKMWILPSDIDSKWRFYFYDCDACMVYIDQDQLSEYNSDIEMLDIHEEFATFVMDKLLQNEQFRDEFAKASYTHLQSTFSPDKVLDKIDEYVSLYTPLVGEHTYRWHQPTDYEKWRNNVKMLRLFAIQRPLVQLEQLTENFGSIFSIYPNPTRGAFNIELKLDDTENFQVQVISLSGRTVYSNNYSNVGDLIELDLPLASGVYFVKLKTSMYNQNEVLIVQ